MRLQNELFYLRTEASCWNFSTLLWTFYCRTR